MKWPPLAGLLKFKGEAGVIIQSLNKYSFSILGSCFKQVVHGRPTILNVPGREAQETGWTLGQVTKRLDPERHPRGNGAFAET